MGQSLRINRPNTQVSKNGAYTHVLEASGLVMYISNVIAKPLNYCMLSKSGKENVTSALFQCEPDNESVFLYELRPGLANIRSQILARPKSNATFPFLMMDEDGNLVVCAYYDPATTRPGRS